MYRDPRGGHNRKRVNENFFKTWSPQMAYVLGFIFADGAIEDLRKSSRTCYIHLASNDKSLLKLGVMPRKSLTMKFPYIPEEYLSFFIRGYFDGDGCLYSSLSYGKIPPRVMVIFTSGSLLFLERLNQRLFDSVGVASKRVFRNGRAFRLKYTKRDGLRLLGFMYQSLESAPYLERKYQIYQQLMSYLRT